MATNDNITGNRMRLLRIERKMTQEEVGQRLGVSKATINKYELGTTQNLSRAKIQALATLFEVSPAYLMGWTNARDGSDLFTTKALAARLASLEDDRDALASEVALYKAQQKLAFTEDQLLYMVMRYAEPEEGESQQDFRKRVIKCFVSEVWVYDEKLEIYFNLTGENDEPRRFVFEQTENCSTNSFYARTQVRVYVTPCGFVVEKETTRA